MEISLTSKQVREQTAESAAPKRSPEYSSEDKIPHIWANIPRQQAKEKREKKEKKRQRCLFLPLPRPYFRLPSNRVLVLCFLWSAPLCFRPQWLSLFGDSSSVQWGLFTEPKIQDAILTSIFSTTNWILWDVDKSLSYFKTEVTAGLKFGNVAGFYLSDVLISNGDFIPDDTHFYMRFHRWFWPLHPSSLHLPDNKGHKSLLKHISICMYEKQGCTVNRISTLGREYGSKLEQRWGASCCRSQNVTTCSNTHTHWLVRIVQIHSPSAKCVGGVCEWDFPSYAMCTWPSCLAGWLPSRQGETT